MLRGEIIVPGDKSISHRALFLGALAEGKTVIDGFLSGKDCLATISCLKSLGVTIKQNTPTQVEVWGQGSRVLKKPRQALDCENSGTTARLILGILAGLFFTATLTGDASLQQRPMGRVVKPLRMMGAEITGREEGDFLPLQIRGGKLKGLKYFLPVASAQLKTALLLAGLVSGEEVEIEEPFKSRDHTERMLTYFGAKLEITDKVIKIHSKQQLTGKHLIVPGDISSAAFFIVATLLSPGSELIIKNVGVNPSRSGVIEILRRMGADIRFLSSKTIAEEPVADILIKESHLKGTEISGKIIPRLIDEIPVLAVAAAFAEGTTVIKDAAELRVKETDRIKAIATELKKIGVPVQELPDGMIIEGGHSLRGAKVKTYGDHRMAMALQVAGLLTEEEIVLDNKECVDISFPGFFELLEKVR